MHHDYDDYNDEQEGIVHKFAEACLEDVSHRSGPNHIEFQFMIEWPGSQGQFCCSGGATARSRMTLNLLLTGLAAGLQRGFWGLFFHSYKTKAQ